MYEHQANLCMSTKPTDLSAIFSSPSQHLSYKPEEIRPLWSRVLIRDIHNDEKIGSILIPQGDVGKDTKRIGIVVAVGPGDKFVEDGLDGQGDVVRRLIGECSHCEGLGRTIAQAWDSDAIGGMVLCFFCCGDGLQRHNMLVKAGDKILYDRRRECEIYLEGVRHSLVYEEQSVLAVLED